MSIGSPFFLVRMDALPVVIGIGGHNRDNIFREPPYRESADQPVEAALALTTRLRIAFTVMSVAAATLISHLVERFRLVDAPTATDSAPPTFIVAGPPTLTVAGPPTDNAAAAEPAVTFRFAPGSQTRRRSRRHLHRTACLHIQMALRSQSEGSPDL